ncbi:MAG: NFACT RNA binding domain-containing protein [Paenibacillaceae bacterium]
MALDGLVTQALVKQLQLLSGAKINKIHQPSQYDIILNVRYQGQTGKLLLSANPTYPRLHLSEQSFMNPMEAPMFCMLLRKHCENGVIDRIEQIGSERIIHIHIHHRDELGDVRDKLIVIELMGRHSNIILLDPQTQTILDGIHHVTPAISSHRIVLPGSRYVDPPDQLKADPLLTSRERFIAIMSEPAQKKPQVNHDDSLFPEIQEPEAPPIEELPVVKDAQYWLQALVDHFTGISPLVAKELVHRSGVTLAQSNQTFVDTPDNVVLEALSSHFSVLIQQIIDNAIVPNIVTLPSGKSSFSITELTHLTGDVVTYPTISECLEAFYGNKAERDTVKQRVTDLWKLIQNNRAKNISKLEKLQDTIDDAKDADRFRILGELLTASMHLVQRGDKQIEVLNYYDENQATVLVPLDPQLTPSDNAQRYFKRYSKMKNSITTVEAQMIATHEEIAYMDTLLQQLGIATMADIAEIREELVEQGYLRHRRKKLKQKKKTDKPKLTCYTSSEGIPIYVGKNNIQNEYLTNRLAQSSDTWLHTKDIPGSHVVIRSTQYNDDTLHEAAMLSAYYSQAKESSQVPVDYTLIRHVHKPSGAKPGYVIYERQKTLFVTPDEQRIKQLKQEQK